MKFSKESNAVVNYFYDNQKVYERGNVVECGACLGNYEPSYSLEKQHGWNFYGFEPDPRYWQELCKNRPNGLNMPMALSDMCGKTTFTISAWGGNSSLQHCENHKKELQGYNAIFPDGTHFKDIVVETIDWGTFIKKTKLSSVELLILDVEGQEMRILNTWNKSSVLPKIIQIEFGYSDHENLYLDPEHNENFSGIIKIAKKLFELDYSFDYVSFNNAYFSLNSFWAGKSKPNVWHFEDEKFVWQDICYYDKSKVRKIMENI